MTGKDDTETIASEKQLVSHLANVHIDQIIFNDIGWTSRVYIVSNGRFVVKFPRTDEVKKEYEQEIAVLKLLEQIKATIQVPKIRWTDANNDYLGYEGIIGQAFDQVAPTTDTAIKQTIGHAIGEFLKQLHALNLDNARTMTIQDEIKEFQYKYGLGLAVIKRDFSEEEQTKLETLIYEEMPTELERLGEEMALCHGDLGYWNMILTEAESVGIIDFGDIGYYDKSKDFIGLEGKEALNEALKVYGDNEILRQKIAIRQKVLSILDLPFFIGKKDEKGIVKTVTKIKAGLYT